MSTARENPQERAVIDVRGLRMKYGDREVLRGVDFSVRRGEVVALLGPNGTGKSTTVEILEGFRGRSGGEVSVLGVDPAQGDEHWRSRIGIVLQSWRDHSKWRVRELLEHFAALYTPYADSGTPRPRDVDELLATVGLEEQAAQRIGSLSGGQRRRLDIAVGVVGRPELLFLDEPTTGFDPEARQEFHTLVKTLADEHSTILLTTHDLHEAEKLADRVLILIGGRIVAQGTVDELARQTGAESEVTWMSDGVPRSRRTQDPTEFVRGLFTQESTDVQDLRVRRVGLEEIYLSVVQHAEAGRTDEAVRQLEEAIA
jgi:ABC-2 type transport system ATP-binding protein